MPGEIEVLKDVARRLEGIAIPYMITGSFAANFYTVPRMTRDIDVVVALRREDVDKVVEAFQGDYYCDANRVREAIAKGTMFNLIHQGSIVKVDFIPRKNVEYRRTEFDRRRVIAVEGQSIWIVAPEDLVLSKLLWAKEGGSEVQMKDVSNLVATASLDGSYLDQWARTLGVDDLLKKARP